MHEAAINKDHLQRASPFHKEVQERETVKNDVLVKVFSTLYWLAKEEIANKKSNINAWIVRKAWIRRDETLPAQIKGLHP